MSLIIATFLAIERLVPTARADRAAGLVEYALLVALIALVAVTAVTQLGTNVRDAGFTSISTAL